MWVLVGKHSYFSEIEALRVRARSCRACNLFFFFLAISSTHSRRENKVVDFRVSSGRSSTGFMSLASQWDQALECSPVGPTRPSAQDQEMDSFDADEDIISEHEKLEKLATSSSLVCLTASSSSIPKASVPNSSQALTSVNLTGMARRQVVHSFDGHEARFLNSDEIKQVVTDRSDRRVGRLERPSLLNALAFKCKSASCPDGQCSKKLEEINVHDLRQSWEVSLSVNGYTEQSSSDAVLRTFCQQYQPSTATERASFKDIIVKVRSRQGGFEDVSLCIATWAVVVANMPVGTLTKMRADVPKRLNDVMSSTTRALTFASSSNDSRDLTETSHKVIPDVSCTMTVRSTRLPCSLVSWWYPK